MVFCISKIPLLLNFCIASISIQFIHIPFLTIALRHQFRITTMQLVWFRQDLRIYDHSALFFAAQQGLCIGVIFLTPEQWRLHQDADIKIDLYLRRLKVLKTQK